MLKRSTGLIVATSVSLMCLIVFPLTVSAQATDCSSPDKISDAQCNPQNNDGACDNGSPAYGSELCTQLRRAGDPISGSDGILTSAVNVMSYVVGAASIMAVLAGSIRYVVANGDANQISAAKKMIIYALIGVLVSVFAQAIVIFVLR